MHLAGPLQRLYFDGDGICRLSDLIPIQNLNIFLNGPREKTVVGWQAQENSSRLTRAGLIALPMDSLEECSNTQICLRWRTLNGRQINGRRLLLKYKWNDLHIGGAAHTFLPKDTSAFV